MIRAGTIDELRQRRGDWAFGHLGFSADSKTCGYLFVPETGSSSTAAAVSYGRLAALLLVDKI
jgi:hypothetical protein